MGLFLIFLIANEVCMCSWDILPQASGGTYIINPMIEFVDSELSYVVRKKLLSNLTNK